MKEITLDDHEKVAAYALNLNAEVAENPVLVTKEGRDYTKHSFTCPIPLLTRAIKLIIALAATVLTGFIGLFSPDVRADWVEFFTGHESLVIFSLKEFGLPEDVIKIFFKNVDLKTLGALASVSKKFNEIQNTPSLWEAIAKNRNIDLDPNNADIKGQVRDAKITLNLGQVDVLGKKITWIGSSDEDEKQKFFQKALSFFGTNAYVVVYLGDGVNVFYYRDQDGIVKSVRTNLMFEDDLVEEDEKLIEEIRKSMTAIELIEDRNILEDF